MVLMLFKKLRAQVKVIVIIVTVTFVGGMLYAGGTSLFGGGAQEQVAQAAIATVNGHPISYYEFQQNFFAQLQQTEQQQGRVEGTRLEAIRYQTLDALVGHILLTQEIENRNITVPDNEINEHLQEIKNQFPSEEDFQNQLQMTGLTEDQLKEYLAQDLQVEKLRDQVTGDVEISAEEIKDAYEEVRASHILIRPEGQNEEDWEAARVRAEEVLQKTADTDFAELAQEYSQDTSASQGGDIGFVSRGETVPGFEEAVFSLAVNEISDLVRTDFGYHIVKVTEQRLAEGEEFEEARAEIEQRLRNEKAQQELVAWFNNLRESADVVIQDNQLLAHERMLEGNYDEAVHYYNLAIEENEEDGYLYASLGEALLELEQTDEAIAAFQQATDIITNDGSLFFKLAQTYHELEMEDEAVNAYLKASELGPMDILLQIQVYNALNQLERYEENKQVEERIDEFQRIQQERQEQQTQQQPQQQMEIDLDELGELDEEAISELELDELEVEAQE